MKQEHGLLRFKKIILLGGICLSFILSGFDQYRVIKPASKKKLAPIIKLIKENEEDREYILDAFMDLNGHIWDNLERIDNITAYILDINNDGIDEVVFVGRMGSCCFLTFAIFSIVDNNARLMNGIISRDDISWPFYNNITHKNELFVKAQNKIYICGNSTEGELSRDIFLCENDTITKVCDKFWINQQRDLFQKLYNMGNFADAFSLLHNFEKKFRSTIDAKTDLWLRNDIALAAIKIKNYNTALEILEQIKKESEFNKTTENFKKAVNFNVNVCLEKLEQQKIRGTRGEYDYCWLLSRKYQPSLDKRFDELIHNTVPDIKIEDIDYRQIKLRLSVSGDVEVKNNRFAIFSGFWPHNATAQALFWCDTKEKVSAVALTSHVTCKINVSFHIKENILVTSKSLVFEELPENFFQELDSWVTNLLRDRPWDEQSIDKYFFYDHNGKATEFKR